MPPDHVMRLGFAQHDMVRGQRQGSGQQGGATSSHVKDEPSRIQAVDNPMESPQGIQIADEQFVVVK
jgi:hypothetical protein